jgi:hypothetical protein
MTVSRFRKSRAAAWSGGFSKGTLYCRLASLINQCGGIWETSLNRKEALMEEIWAESSFTSKARGEAVPERTELLLFVFIFKADFF